MTTPDMAQRIAQFENMVAADPTNDMAHFSLGGAYTQVARYADAANAYLKCVEINPKFSKAYQLAGQALISAGEPERAAEVLTAGFTSAAALGDRMPQKAMGELLTKIGKPVPQVASASGAMPPGTFVEPASGKGGTKMTKAPFKGPVGNWIFENITQETFDEWIRQGTKVINELRLDLSREDHAETYDKYMYEYLGIDDALLAKLKGQ
ncbi:MAG: Fe(2+)-trafficking protein [Planctomycetes bacterium]|nr:Fe(2+)-trafficking protein [Planctomycetota bacterium]